MDNQMFNKQVKTLYAFDFDYTVVDGCTDRIVPLKLAIGSHIPAEIEKLYTPTYFTQYMQAIFDLLHQQGITQQMYQQCLWGIDFVPGMKELFRQLGSMKGNAEVIILSDANKWFIEEILTYHQLDGFVTKVFSNVATFDERGCLRINDYQLQNNCHISTKSLCKGDVLCEYVEQREVEGVTFENVVYVGDGANDLCPAKRLSNRDHLFVRKGFKLEKELEKDENTLTVNIHLWESGYEMSKLLDLPEFAFETSAC